MSARMHARLLLLPLLAAALLPGCAAEQELPDYTRPLPPGADALRKLEPHEWPELSPALSAGDAELIAALDRSLAWFKAPSTTQFFPKQGITHEQARASVFALREAMKDPATAEQTIRRDFDIYTSVGWDGSGTVLFTGYYSPIFDASRQRTPEYQYPLYNRPPDLVTDEATGEVRGRKLGDRIVPYPTRAQIEYYPQRLGLQGRELVWVKSKLDAFIIHVNGSARLKLRDGSIVHIGYAATNGLEYTSIGKLLVADGRIPRDRISLPAIQEYFQEHPDRLDHYILQNDRYVFFQPFEGDAWPAGSLGVKITPMRSIATDKSLFPRGCPTLVVTQVPDPDRPATAEGPATRTFQQLMADQDTGGAIRSAGRADLYLGVGPRAGWMAGRQVAEGRLYYLLLKPQSVAAWTAKMQQTLARR